MVLLRWVASSSASACYAASVLARGEATVDSTLFATLRAPVAELAQVLATGGIPPELFWEQIVPLAVGIENDRSLAEVILRKTVGPAAAAELIAELAARLGAVERAFRQVSPGAVAELELRSGPLREQWEARGPGLLAAIGREIGPELIVDRADVCLVPPIRGGGGRAYLTHNAVAIEAVLANPHYQLPEIVRLALLISTLNLDLPRYSENISRTRLPQLAGLATLPAAIAAAEYVELARDDAATWELAIRAWHLAADGGQAEVAAILNEWWLTYRATRPTWPVALEALNRMLPAAAK